MVRRSRADAPSLPSGESVARKGDSAGGFTLVIGLRLGPPRSTRKPASALDQTLGGPHVPLGFARRVGGAVTGSSGQGCFGYCPRMSARTAAQEPRQKPGRSRVIWMGR